MELTERSISRRTLLRTAAASALLLPFGVTLASCAGPSGAGGGETPAPGGERSADNPFGVAANTTVDAVIFNGGYGIDYVEEAGVIMEGNPALAGVTVTVAPTTKVAQEMQPRFVGGNPPDLLDNEGANQIGIATILDQIEDLTELVDSDNLEGVKIRDTLQSGALDSGIFNGKLAAINYVMTVFAVWYSGSLFAENNWSIPETWEDLPALGAAAKEQGKYLFLFGKEAATYYYTFVVDSAIVQAGDEFRVPFENLGEGCWSHPAMQGILEILYELVQSGYVKPGGSGTQFTEAQAQWSLDQEAVLYPSGAWIENEMKSQTLDGFEMKGFAAPPLNKNQATPKGTLHAQANERFIVPSKGKNPAGGKELLRTMLSQEAATSFARNKLAPTIVKDTVPADGFGSTALASQVELLNAAGDNIFPNLAKDLYGINSDLLPIWGSFLEGNLTVAEFTEQMQGIFDRTREDDSVIKIEVN